MSAPAKKSSKKLKDAAMAAYMKARKIERNYLKCAICHFQVGMQGYENHLRACKGREK